MPSAKKLAFLDRKRKLKEEKGELPSPDPSAVQVTKKIKLAKPHRPHKEKPTQAPSIHKTPNPKPEKLTEFEEEVKTETKVTESNDKISTLFVRNLNFKTTKEELETFFSNIAPVKHTVIVSNPETSISLGYGFVSFATPEDARSALTALKAEKLGGRIIKIEFAEKRERADSVKKSEKETRLEAGVEQRKKQKEGGELIVRNLPWSIRSPDDLRVHFTGFGKVTDVRIPRAKGAKMSGFGFVVFKSRACAERAIEGVNGLEIDGRVVAVDWAVKQDEYEKAKEEEDQEDGDIKSESEEEELDDTVKDKEDDEDLEDDQSGDESKDTEEDEDGDEDEFDEVKAEEIRNAEDDKDSESEEEEKRETDPRDGTIFVRNLLFETTEQEIYSHFRIFGPLRYARIVVDHFTGRSRGTAFVKFVHPSDAEECLALASSLPQTAPDSVSLMISEEKAEGDLAKFVLGGRLLNVVPALKREEADQKIDEHDKEKREKQGKGTDKRNMFLLNEGRIDPGKSAGTAEKMSEADLRLRQTSLQQRKSLLQRNPGLHLSLVRLSVRNLPRHVGSRELKHLARQAVVGFATDVTSGHRQPISKEELKRDPSGSKKSGNSGIVKQAKVVFEKDGGRSRGYGFISYANHKYALMGLRWLNARNIGTNLNLVEMKNAKPLPAKEDVDVEDRKRRLIVEFAIENVSVVKRRVDKETKAKTKAIDDKEAKLKEVETKKQEGRKKRDRETTAEEDEISKMGRIISQKRQKKRMAHKR